MKSLVSILFCALCLFALVSQVQGHPLTGEGILFFDRGHYWIELTFYDPEGRDILLPEPGASEFTVMDEDGDQEAFEPSRVDIISSNEREAVFLLVSGKIKGGKCYRVSYEPAGGSRIVISSICDPFYFVPDRKECAAKRFFRRYIAAAFSRSGDVYKLNQFKYEYDYSSEESNSKIAIQPVFKISGLKLEPVFKQDKVTYDPGGPGKTSVSKRMFGIAVSKSGWAGDIRLSLTAGYDHDRSLFSVNMADSVSFSHALKVAGRVRLDNFFDSVNRYCRSVFKGVDLGFGYAWYQSDDEEVWESPRFEQTTPFFNARFTWTVLYGFQFSYSIESCWPTSLNERFEEFHSFKVRLLLRDVLAKPSSKPYHPDLEFALDTGRRLPLFEKEEKISLGFTFDLYPW